MSIHRAISAAAVMILATAVFVSGTTSARSINDAIGKTSFTWLKSIADAGISGAGETFAARDGAEALLVHPAAVAGIERPAAKLSYVSYYVDTQFGSVGYAGRIRGRDLGIRLTYVNFGEFTRTDRTGQRLGTFTAGDIGITLNLGRKLRDDLKVGVMASYFNSRLEDFTAQAVTVDLGALYTPPFEGFTVGATLMNLGAVTKNYSSGYSETLPVTLIVGAAKQLTHAPITLFADVRFPNDNDIIYAFGIKASIQERLFLYAGTRSRNTVDTEIMKAETDIAGVTSFGFGVMLDRYRFNYAYCPDDVIEDVHKVTLMLQVP